MRVHDRSGNCAPADCITDAVIRDIQYHYNTRCGQFQHICRCGVAEQKAENFLLGSVYIATAKEGHIKSKTYSRKGAAVCARDIVAYGLALPEITGSMLIPSVARIPDGR